MQEGVGDEQGDRHEQRREVDGLGEEERDDGDGTEIVDDSQRQQERAKGRGERRPHDSEDGECKGDVRGHRDCPPVGCPRITTNDQEVDGRGHDHAGQGSDDREDRLVQPAEASDHELSFELDTRDEEEDRQETIGCPLLQREVEMEGGRAYHQVLEVLVRVSES